MTGNPGSTSQAFLLSLISIQVWSISATLWPRDGNQRYVDSQVEVRIHVYVIQSYSPSPSDIEGLTVNQIVVFLERIQLFKKPLTAQQSQAMGKAYSLTDSRNVELSSRYLGIALMAKDETAYQPAASLLGKVGRMKFVRPLYRKLSKVDRKLALETFEKNKDFYHPICRAQVEKDLKDGE